MNTSAYRALTDETISMTGNSTHIEREVTIVNTQGLHARPVMRFVDIASQFQATVRVTKGSTSVDGKSPMEMMLLEGTPGTRLKLIADGPDAAAVVEALSKLVADRFYED